MRTSTHEEKQACTGKSAPDEKREKEREETVGDRRREEGEQEREMERASARLRMRVGERVDTRESRVKGAVCVNM